MNRHYCLLLNASRGQSGGRRPKRIHESRDESLLNSSRRLVADDRASYQYLVESIQKFHTQEELSNLARDAGFRFVSHSNLTGGVVAVHSGVKLSR